MVSKRHINYNPPLTGPLAEHVWYHHRTARFYPKVNSHKKSTMFPDQNAIPVNGRIYTHEELAAEVGVTPGIWRARMADVARAELGYLAMKAKYQKEP
jgi:hypothetical protein